MATSSLLPVSKQAQPAEPPMQRLIFCVVGIFVSFMMYGFLLERFTFGGKKISELALLTMNSAICATFARAAMVLKGERPRKVPSHYFVAIACTYLGGMFMSIRALRYVNYPTRILAKSAKAVPIMMMNFVFGKRYKPMQYASILLIVGGTCIFMLYKPGGKSGGSTTATGALLLVISLMCDGTTGALEDKLLAELGWKHGEGSLDLMYYINLYATPITFVGLLVTGDASELFGMDLSQTAAKVMLGVALAVGQLILFYTIANFGAVICSIITTSRKVVQIVFSIMWFGHPVAGAQFVGLAVAVSGLGLNVHSKRSK